MAQELDLTPDPRVLQMLGEITLPQWRCLAELIDNSIDGFTSAESAIENPEITVSLPSADTELARVVVKDNGPGMSIETLEHALRAGWTGNNPLSALGLFGMGFNIATARLGLVTEVWTTRVGDPEYVGVRIDLNELRATRSFKVPRQTRPKADHTDHGTEIIISKLKPDQRAYLYRSTNQKTVRKQLARTYSALLARTGAGRFRLQVNGARVEALRPCVWDESRSVELPDGTNVAAIERFDIPLASRRYCVHCMRTLANDEAACPTGSPACEIVETPRRLHGWVGIQRYLDETTFGLDFIRNGRKIEIGNKELFVWTEGETPEPEYPIDDPRGRGRFVGEIHMDHCRVTYTKDRFERDDPAWGEMVRLVRGEGPLRPIAAKKLSYEGNDSPLYKLFQAFRRSSPQGKNGLWSRVLVVRDNDRAKQMANAFHEGDAEFLTDDRWWQLVEEQDKEVLGDKGASEKPADAPEVPEGFVDEGEATPPEKPTTPPAPEPEVKAPPTRHALHELSRKYAHPTYRVEYEVQAFAVDEEDPDLPAGAPWLLRLDDVATRTYGFLVNVNDDVFRSTTMTPLDGLMVELAHRTVDFLKGQIADVSLAGVLADLRALYCRETRLDPQEIIALASAALADIATGLSGRMQAGQGMVAFEELEESEREAIVRRMADREIADHKAAISDGRFWDYAQPGTVRRYFNRRPGAFLDGAYWEDSYASLDFGSERVTSEARERVKARYDAYLADAIWLASQSASDLERADRDALVRATCSVRLLRPDLPD